MTDEHYLIMCKGAGLPDEQIAGRLGITVEQLREKWTRLLNRLSGQINGDADFRSQFAHLAGHYQLLGESLKIIANALSNQPSLEEIEAVLTEDKKQSAEAILQNFLIFRPFVVQCAEESLKSTIRDN